MAAARLEHRVTRLLEKKALFLVAFAAKNFSEISASRGRKTNGRERSWKEKKKKTNKRRDRRNARSDLSENEEFKNRADNTVYLSAVCRADRLLKKRDEGVNIRAEKRRIGRHNEGHGEIDK